MCLILLSLQEHPRYKLIIATNRDEFYNRRTAAAGFWKDHPNIIGGRDLEANGTWLGMTKSGRISMLTNYRDPKNIDPNAPSRGRLVADYLESNLSAENYLHKVEENSNAFNGFNLITGTVDELWYLSNYRKGIQQVTPGLHGLSNQLLDTPWPKVIRGLQKFRRTILTPDFSPEDLFGLLYDDEVAPDGKLPDTGIGLERERALSSMFIKTPNYGSRCSTVILVDHDNRVTFSERVYDLTTFAFATNTFSFTVEGEGGEIL